MFPQLLTLARVHGVGSGVGWEWASCGWAVGMGWGWWWAECCCGAGVLVPSLGAAGKEVMADVWLPGWGLSWSQLIRGATGPSFC